MRPTRAYGIERRIRFAIMTNLLKRGLSLGQYVTCTCIRTVPSTAASVRNHSGTGLHSRLRDGRNQKGFRDANAAQLHQCLRRWERAWNWELIRNFTCTSYLHEQAPGLDIGMLFGMEPRKYAKEKRGSQPTRYPRQPRRGRDWTVSVNILNKIREDVLVARDCPANIVNKQEPLGAALRPILDFSRENSTQSVTEAVQRLGNEEILGVLGQLVAASDIRHHSELIQCLEDECCRRTANLAVKDQLYIADAFYLLGHEPERYYRMLFHYWDQYLDRLEPSLSDVLQLLLMMAAYRNAPISLLRSIEEYLSKQMQPGGQCPDGNDIGLICYAYFVTNTRLNDYTLLKQLAARTLEDVKRDRMHVYLLGNVMKAFRHAGFNDVGFFQELCDVLTERCPRLPVDRLNCSSLVNIAITLASLRIVHDAFFGILNDYFCSWLQQQGSQLNATRTKELVKLLSTAQTLQAPTPHMVRELVMGKMRSDLALTRLYPETFIELLVALAGSGHYPLDLLTLALSDNYLKWKAGRLLEQHFQTALLDQAVRIECPEYEGNHPSKRTLGVFATPRKEELAMELSTRQGLAIVLTAAQSVLGDPARVRLHYILNHSMLPDLEIVVDREGTPQCFQKEDITQVAVSRQGSTGALRTSITEDLLKDKDKHIYHRGTPEEIHLVPKKSSTTNSRRVVLKVLSWNQYALNVARLLGLSSMELRLLRTLGCEIVVINPVDAARLDQGGLAATEEYLRQLFRKLGIRTNNSTADV